MKTNTMAVVPSRSKSYQKLSRNAIIDKANRAYAKAGGLAKRVSVLQNVLISEKNAARAAKKHSDHRIEVLNNDRSVLRTRADRLQNELNDRTARRNVLGHVIFFETAFLLMIIISYYAR